MRDKSGAQRVPAGSSLGILPANSGGVATQQRAPGHERPRTASSDAAWHGRLSAASTAPGYDVPRSITVRAPGHDCQSAAPRAPGLDAPLASTARTPRHDRLSAAHPAPDHNRSGATLAAVSVPDHSHVSPLPASGYDRSRRVPLAAGSPSASVTHPATLEETVYDRIVTKQDVQRLVQAATAPLLDEEVRLLQVLIQRVVATGYDPTPPHGQRRAAPTVRRRQRAALIENITVVCRAVDVLQRTLKTRQALASDSASVLFQLLDEAAKYLEADEYGAQGAPPGPPPTITPL